MTEDTKRRGFQLQRGLADSIQKFVGPDKKYGYASDLAFVEDAVRRRIEQLEREERVYLKE